MMSTPPVDLCLACLQWTQYGEPVGSVAIRHLEHLLLLDAGDHDRPPLWIQSQELHSEKGQNQSVFMSAVATG